MRLPTRNSDLSVISRFPLKIEVTSSYILLPPSLVFLLSTLTSAVILFFPTAEVRRILVFCCYFLSIRFLPNLIIIHCSGRSGNALMCFFAPSISDSTHHEFFYLRLFNCYFNNILHILVNVSVPLHRKRNYVRRYFQSRSTFDNFSLLQKLFPQHAIIPVTATGLSKRKSILVWKCVTKFSI